MQNLKLNSNIISGKNELHQLIKYLDDNNFKNVFLIYDANLFINNKYFSNFINKNKFFLKDEYSYHFEPSYELLNKKINYYKSLKKIKKVDVIVAIGGGSTIDFAKGIAILLKNLNKSPLSLRGFPKNYKTPLPVIAIPSTCGTGSEVAFNASFIHEKNKSKLGINVYENYPILAILDPLLIKGSPKKVMYSSTMDTLVHTLEGFISVKSSTHSRLFSKKAFKLFHSNIFKIINDKYDEDDLSNLQWSSSYAMMGMSNASHGLSGALSYYLGTHYQLSHGIAGAIFLHKINYLNHSKGYYDLGLLIDNNKISLKNRSKQVLDFIEKIINIFLLEFQLKDIYSLLKFDKNLNMFIDTIKPVFALNPVKLTKKDISSIL